MLFMQKDEINLMNVFRKLPIGRILKNSLVSDHLFLYNLTKHPCRIVLYRLKLKRMFLYG